MALDLLRSLPTDIRIVCLTVSIAILFAGFLTFVLPTYFLVNFVRRKKEDTLRDISKQLEDLGWDDVDVISNPEREVKIEALLSRWTAISVARAVPRRILIAGQVAVLVILPLIEGLAVARLL
jgi:hypothetical protein